MPKLTPDTPPTPSLAPATTDAIKAILRHLSPDKPVLIYGPTASGKSALAMAIAETQGGVVINADALQIYGCFRLLTARPSAADEAALPHRLYGHVGADTPYSAGQWLRDITALTDTSRWIVIGGTGLYFRALTQGFAEAPPAPDSIRQHCLDKLQTEGLASLLADLAARDPATLSRIDTANPRRVQRAWEVLEHTGRGLANWQDDTPAPALPLHEAQPLAVNAPRDWLSQRGARRIDRMIKEGVLAELAALKPIWRDDLPAAKAIGARELMAHLNGSLSLEAAYDAMSLQTRQYIKRQQTWLRKTATQGWTQVDARALVA